ncbi:hypothetical protein GGQ88_003755 [Novosphingobium hassiacum]|uniref:Uncharacterized protein n=1 Tax=Novosphingobium hassiacum TaxID=173676 RepID=A0A7W6A1G0_9SPHN|nr:hypothetical protein [Novosphingobium hassiacum]MBB3862454.1 hypothetical protein [Novosphingobium hassiacum]
MNQTASSHSVRRRSLLAGGAVLALAGSLATPAFATPTRGIEATGAQVIATDQSKDGSPVSASAANPRIEATGLVDGSSIALAGNTVSAAARANSASAALTPDSRDLAAATGGTWLASGTDGTDAQASALIATRQSTDAAQVSAATTNSRIRARLGDLVDSSATVSSNAQEAVALANDAADTLFLTGVTVGTGAGIVSDQSVGGDASVAARFSGQAGLKVADASGSDLAVGQNLQRAVAYGNSAANALGIDAVQLDAAASYGTPSLVEANASDPEVNAAYAVLANQRLASGVAARANGGFTVTVNDGAVASNVTNDGNSLAAAGYGNQSSNRLDLSADTVANDARGGGAVANITSVQSASAVPVKADSRGGARIAIAGDAVETSLGARDNAVLAVATANRADGNLLSVTANGIDAGTGTGSGGEGEGGIVLVPPVYIGTALVGGDGEMSVTAPFSVQNDQNNQARVAASAKDAATLIAVDAAIIRSNATISGNSAGAQASGNEATNGLSFEANRLATAADLNSLQQGTGGVSAAVGSARNRAGATLYGGGDVVDSSLTVSDNGIEANATGNTVTNSMAIIANNLTNASGHENARAGLIDSGVGASADYALANSQEIMGSYLHPAGVEASAFGAFGAVAGEGAVRSALNVTGNSQTASALGNGAVNSRTIAATTLGEGNDPAPGSALSSAQMASASVNAVSDMQLGVTSAAVDSGLLLSANSNVARAGMNDATNSLAVDALRTGTLSGEPASVLADAGFSRQVMGDHVLASNQIADGSVNAMAVTTGRPVDPAMSLVRSGFEASDNATLASAVANNAGNSLALTSALQGGASAGLLNQQLNYAAVGAQATSTYGIGVHASSDATSLVDNNATSAIAHGNIATNSVAVSGVAESDCTPDLASITTGALNAAMAPALLSNAQMNTGGVSAHAVSPTVSLSYGGVSDSRLGVTGNSVTAAAYGNSATNSVTLASLGTLPVSGISSVQTNSGAVTAQVTNAAYTVTSSSLSAGRIGISGNSVSASAIGNTATSKVTVSR